MGMDTKQWLCAEASSGCASAGACVLPAAAPHAPSSCTTAPPGSRAGANT